MGAKLFMQITLTWADFKSLNVCQSNQVVFVKDANNDVNKVVVFSELKEHVMYVLSNPPSKNNFLSTYPDALQVSDITS